MDQEENWDLCLNSGKAIGCRVHGLSIGDLMDAKPQALLRLVWEIIKVVIVIIIMRRRRRRSFSCVPLTHQRNTFADVNG